MISDIKNFLLMSDSHRNPELMKKIIKDNCPSTIIFLGDFTFESDSDKKDDQIVLCEWLDKDEKRKLILTKGSAGDSYLPLELLVKSRNGSFSGKKFISDNIIAVHDPFNLPLNALQPGIIGLVGHYHTQDLVFYYIDSGEKITKNMQRQHLVIMHNIPISLHKKLIYIVNPGCVKNGEYAIFDSNSLIFKKSHIKE